MILVLSMCLSGRANVYAISGHPSLLYLSPFRPGDVKLNVKRNLKIDPPKYCVVWITKTTFVPYPVRAEIEMKRIHIRLYRGADKSLAQTTSRWILYDGENISFDASLVTYINITNIPPIVIINRIF